MPKGSPAERTRTRIAATLVLLASVSIAACAHHVANSQARQQASATGTSQVRLTTDAESVMGTCTYVRAIQPDLIPINPPTDAQLPDYYREQAAYYGADTVLVKGRVGEAYVCGPAHPTPTPK